MNGINIAKRIIAAIPRDSIGKYELLPLAKETKLFVEVVEHLSTPFVGKLIMLLRLKPMVGL